MSETPAPDSHTGTTSVPTNDPDTGSDAVLDAPAQEVEPVVLDVPDESNDADVTAEGEPFRESLDPTDAPNGESTSADTGDLSDQEATDVPDGAAEPTNPPVADGTDPDAAVFVASTGHSDSEEPEEPPEEATGELVGTGHQEHVPDDTVTENAPVPVTDDQTAEWNALRDDVTTTKEQVAELYELVMVVAPALRQVSQDVAEQGLAGLIGAFMRGPSR